MTLEIHQNLLPYKFPHEAKKDGYSQENRIVVRHYASISNVKKFTICKTKTLQNPVKARLVQAQSK